MAIPSAPYRTVTDSQHMTHNGSCTGVSAPLGSPHDDVAVKSLTQSVPSTRHIELETLLRQRDAQNEQLTVEVTTLRRFLVNQPAPSTSEPITLPPPLLSLLLPYLADPLAADPSSSSSNSVMVALTQRTKLLQEENDELYELLKHSETGRLKEEVRGLRRAVRRMEGALKESHGIINSLSLELDKCYETFTRTSDVYLSSGPSQSYSELSGNPRAHTNHAHSNATNATSTKPIPTGPRAQKRPRLSHASVSPPQTSRPLPAIHGNLASPHQNHTALPPNARHGESSPRMEVDEEVRGRGRTTPDRDRHRERGRDRDRDRNRGRDAPPHQAARRSKERDRDREREWERERERGGRRNGGGRDRRVARGSAGTNGSGSRGLVERMGL